MILRKVARQEAQERNGSDRDGDGDGDGDDDGDGRSPPTTTIPSEITARGARRRLAEPSSTRDRIMDAVVACVDRGGLAGFALEDVAAEAGVSRATIYRHFEGGRDQLVREAVTREVARFWTELAAGGGGHRRPRGPAGRRG